MRIDLNHNFWMEVSDGSLELKVGLTPEYLKRLGVIWTFIPKTAITVDVKENDIIANLESSKCLGPLRSPLTGIIVKWNDHFLEYPEKINSENYLLIIRRAT